MLQQFFFALTFSLICFYYTRISWNNSDKSQGLGWRNRLPSVKSINQHSLIWSCVIHYDQNIICASLVRLAYFSPGKSGKFCYLRGTVARDFWSRFFSWIYSIWAPDFEAKRIFFSLSFSRRYSNISMNQRCRLLRGFKISAVGYCADSNVKLWTTADQVRGT